MTIYLSDGWYKPGNEGGLRTEVLDGAMDAAGLLYRAGISAELVSRLALRVRGMIRLGETTAQTFSDKEREYLADRLLPMAGDSAEVTSFISDCLDHISCIADLSAFYLHLVHINRMMQLLAMARLGQTGYSRAATSLTLPQQDLSDPKDSDIDHENHESPNASHKEK